MGGKSKLISALIACIRVQCPQYMAAAVSILAAACDYMRRRGDGGNAPPKSIVSSLSQIITARGAPR